MSARQTILRCYFRQFIRVWTLRSQHNVVLEFPRQYAQHSECNVVALHWYTIKRTRLEDTLARGLVSSFKYVVFGLIRCTELILACCECRQSGKATTTTFRPNSETHCCWGKALLKTQL